MWRWRVRSLWWSDRRIIDEGVAVRPGSRAFISAGECEEGDVSRVWPSVFANAAQREFAAMVRNAEEFGRLCAQVGVDTQTVVFPDEHHVTLVPASLARAIQHLYA